MKRITFATLSTLILLTSCTIETPGGNYRLIPDEFDHKFTGDFEVNIKGEDNNADINSCPTRETGNTYYVAIARTPPVGKTCTLDGVTYSIHPKEFNTLESAKDFADAIAYTSGLDTIYGTNKPR